MSEGNLENPRSPTHSQRGKLNHTKVVTCQQYQAKKPTHHTALTSDGALAQRDLLNETMN